MSKRLKTSEEEEKEVVGQLLAIGDVIHNELVRVLPLETRVYLLCGTCKRLRAAFGYPHVIGSRAAPVTLEAPYTNGYRFVMHLSLRRFLQIRSIEGLPMHVRLHLAFEQSREFDAVERSKYIQTTAHAEKMRIESADVEDIRALTYMPSTVGHLLKDVTAVHVHDTGFWNAVDEMPSPLETRKSMYAAIRSIQFDYLGWRPDSEVLAFQDFFSVLHPDASMSIQEYDVSSRTRLEIPLERVQDVGQLRIWADYFTDIARQSDATDRSTIAALLQPMMNRVVSLMRKARVIVCHSTAGFRRRFHALDELLRLFATTRDQHRHTSLIVDITRTAYRMDPLLSPIAASLCTDVTLMVEYAARVADELVTTLRELVHFTSMTRLHVFIIGQYDSFQPRLNIPKAAATIIGGHIDVTKDEMFTVEIVWNVPPNPQALRTLAREIYRLAILWSTDHVRVYRDRSGEKAAEMAAAAFE